MNKKLFSFFGLLLILAALVTTGFGCRGNSVEVQKYLEPIELNYWRVWDDADSFTDIIKAYEVLHPNIEINYRKFRYDEYEKELLEAMAEDRGPDIFSLPESWLREYQNRIEPMPETITLAHETIKGTIKKEKVIELRTQKTPSLREIKENFVDVVSKNAVIDNKVYGLPLSLETLVMFYNRDIFNKTGVTTVPTDWKSFQEAVQKITRLDESGRIVQAGSAIGSGANITRSFDLLSVLMMQNGAPMTDVNGFAAFTQETDNFSPGVEAIGFYTDFANPTKSVYTWNNELPNSLEAFISGKAGMIFGYNYYLPTIRNRAPQLNFSLAPIPQVNPDSPTNYGNYWLETVSKKSKNIAAAWDFILFASQKDQAQKFLEKTQRPTALKALISSQLENDDLYAVSNQTLTADNWYQGKDAPAAEQAMVEMIDSFLNAASERDAKKIIELAIQKINQTIK